MSKNGDAHNSPSHKWQKQRKAIALTVGTCLVMGILALEIVRVQGGSKKNAESGQGSLIILKNPEDSQLAPRPYRA